MHIFANNIISVPLGAPVVWYVIFTPTAAEEHWLKPHHVCAVFTFNLRGGKIVDSVRKKNSMKIQKQRGGLSPTHDEHRRHAPDYLIGATDTCLLIVKVIPGLRPLQRAEKVQDIINETSTHTHTAWSCIVKLACPCKLLRVTARKQPNSPSAARVTGCAGPLPHALAIYDESHFFPSAS